MREFKQYFAPEALETVAGDVLDDFYADTLKHRVIRALRIYWTLKNFAKRYNMMT